MGLDFSHCNAHWSYSGFNAFRRRLGAIIGINLDSMEGFVVDGVSWDTVTDDELVPLLNHSDCDGVLTAEQCKLVAPRLLEIVGHWKDDYDKENALMLVDGMWRAAKAGEPLQFC